MRQPASNPDHPGTPFPLLRVFGLVLLPIIVMASVGLAVAMVSGISASAEALFAKAEIGLVRTILSRRSASDLPNAAQPATIAHLEGELDELGITCLSVVTARGDVSLAVSRSQTCKVPVLEALRPEILEAGTILVEDLILPAHWTSLGTLGSANAVDGAIVIVTRPARSLESAISTSAIFWAGLFCAVFVSAIAATTSVVYRAQRTIDAQAAYVDRVHRRLRSFLPMAAVRDALDAGSAPQRFEAVVMFVDLRDFSSFAEASQTDAVAALIDSFVTRVADVVAGHNGEIDKIIGDGVLAVFHGEHAVAQSVDAAVDCIRTCSLLERSPGIGLYRGDVIATALGTSARADFTVLGRTVNLASRLCSLAKANEIVIPACLELGRRTDIVEQSRERVTPRHHQRSEEVIRYRLTR